MTMFPTPRQIADTQRAVDAITIQAKKERVALLERLIEKYASHVVSWAGVYYLEDRYRGNPGAHSSQFTDEEWKEIRLLAKEDNE